jgi:hypothetical protein
MYMWSEGTHTHSKVLAVEKRDVLASETLLSVRLHPTNLLWQPSAIIADDQPSTPPHGMCMVSLLESSNVHSAADRKG